MRVEREVVLERLECDVEDLRNVYRDLKDLGLCANVRTQVANAGMLLQKFIEYEKKRREIGSEK